MDTLSNFLDKYLPKIKKSTFWLQIVTLFFAFLTYVYSDFLVTLYNHSKDFSSYQVSTILPECLQALILVSCVSFLISLLVLYAERHQWHQLQLICHTGSALLAFVIAILLLNSLTPVSIHAIYQYNLVLFGLLILLTLSVILLFRNLYCHQAYLITTETTKKLFADIRTWIVTLPVRTAKYFKEKYQSIKETWKYHLHYRSTIQKADLKALIKKEWLSFTAFLSRVSAYFKKKPAEVVEDVPKVIPQKTKKDVPDVSEEMEERIASAFKKPRLFKKRYILVMLFCFVYLAVNAFYTIVDWSKETIDPFQGMTLTYHGISGEGTASIEVMPYSDDDPELNEFLSTLKFRIESNADLRNGDRVKVVLTKYDEELLNRHNYKLETLTKEFQIIRLDTIPESLNNLSGTYLIEDAMDEVMRKRQSFMTRYVYEPVIECYSPDPTGTTHYTYFIESKYGVFLRVYDVKESFTFHGHRLSYAYAYLSIYDHIVINQSNEISDFRRFVGARIGEIDYKQYMRDLQRHNNFKCTYLLDD